MNFTEDMDDSLPVGKKPLPRKGNESQQDVAGEESKLDQIGMDMAQKSGERMHHNEQSNSSNTTFSK